MPRTVYKNLRSRQAQQNEEEIRLLLGGLLAACRDYEKQLAARLFLVLKRAVSYKLLIVGQNARLSGFDEQLADCYRALLDRYETMLVSDEPRGAFGSNAKIQSIVSGVYNVIASRVRHRTENVRVTKENPIAEEKRRLATNAIGGVIAEYDRLFAAHADDMIQIPADVRKGMTERRDAQTGRAVFAEQLQAVLRLCGAGMYESYEKAARDLCDRLSDMSSRREYAFYDELLTDETGVLSAIVRVQVAAIESEQAAANLSENEKKLLNTFIAGILEAYQHLKQGAEGIAAARAKAAQMPGGPSIEPLNGFLESLRAKAQEDAAFPESVLSAFRESTAPEFEKLKAAAGKELGHRLDKKIGGSFVVGYAYSMQKTATGLLMMAADMTEAFRVVSRWREQAGGEALSDIVAGVCETIDIKIESITDGAAAFRRESEIIIEAMQRDNAVLPAETLESLLDESLLRFFDNLPDNLFGGDAHQEPLQRDIRAALDLCLENENVEAALADVSRKLSAHRDKHAKKAAEFKRSGLLYEVSTFEEMMNYSVSRLRESESAADLSFAAMADGVMKALLELLKRNGIAVIMPRPHEAFDGKAHEVLMAEVHEGFLKGEIIKVMNAGYMQDGAVLMRANVIAAK